MKKFNFIEVIALTLCVSFLGVMVVAAITPGLTSFHEVGMSRLEARILWHEATATYSTIGITLLWVSFGCAIILLSYLIGNSIAEWHYRRLKTNS